jgi:hypothetical protein
MNEQDIKIDLGAVWVHTIEIIEEYPMFSRMLIKDSWSKKLIRDIKIAGRLHLYNMVHVLL